MFDAQIENVVEISIWVRLLGLPPQFETEEVLRCIGNILGSFLEVDMAFRETREKSLA